MSNKDRFQEKVTPYLKQLSETSDAVREMYYFDPEHEDIPADTSRDILIEKQLTKTKGLVHKFPSRVLFLLSYTCAANCRFCERQDRVGVGLDKFGRLKEEDILNAVEYIAEHPEINEVIFSGGDPLTYPKGLLFAFKKLQEINHVKILRIHTKFPVQYPEKTDFDLLQTLSEFNITTYFSIHINHPDELNDMTVPVLKKIRRMGYIMLCQSVFLKGVNDDYEVLYELFRRLSEIGVRPYYIYHCQSIPTTSKFVMKIEKEVEIMTKLRENLSGVAFPQHVIDIQNTTGKVVVPTNHWTYISDSVKDFLGNDINLSEYDRYS